MGGFTSPFFMPLTIWLLNIESKHGRGRSNEILTKPKLKRHRSAHYSLTWGKRKKTRIERKTRLSIYYSTAIITPIPRRAVCQQRNQKRKTKQTKTNKTLQDTSTYGYSQLDKLSVLQDPPKRWKLLQHSIHTLKMDSSLLWQRQEKNLREQEHLHNPSS